MRVLCLLALLATLVSSPALAASVDLSFNDSSFRVGGEMALTASDVGDSIISGSYLYEEHNDTEIGTIGLDFCGYPGVVPGLSTGIGAKVYDGWNYNLEYFTNIGIGFRTDYTPPELLGVGFDLGFYFAPEVFSIRNDGSLTDAYFRLTYQLIPKAEVFIGYRRTEIDIEDSGSETLDSAFRIGFIGTF